MQGGAHVAWAAGVIDFAFSSTYALVKMPSRLIGRELLSPQRPLLRRLVG